MVTFNEDLGSIYPSSTLTLNDLFSGGKKLKLVFLFPWFDILKVSYFSKTAESSVKLKKNDLADNSKFIKVTIANIFISKICCLLIM